VYLTVDLEPGRAYRLADDELGIETTFTPHSR
jgi:hypothetical protein